MCEHQKSSKKSSRVELNLDFSSNSTRLEKHRFEFEKIEEVSNNRKLIDTFQDNRENRQNRGFYKFVKEFKCWVRPSYYQKVITL